MCEWGGGGGGTGGFRDCSLMYLLFIFLTYVNILQMIVLFDAGIPLKNTYIMRLSWINIIIKNSSTRSHTLEEA